MGGNFPEITELARRREKQTPILQVRTQHKETLLFDLLLFGFSSMGQAGLSKPLPSPTDADSPASAVGGATAISVPSPPAPSDSSSALNEIVELNPSMGPLLQEMRNTYALMERRSRKLESQNDLLRRLHDGLRRDNDQKDKELKELMGRLKQLEMAHNEGQRERMAQEAQHNKLVAQWKVKEAEYEETIEGIYMVCVCTHDADAILISVLPFLQCVQN